MTTEIWKPIPGYEGIYEVGDMGNVRSLRFDKCRLLKPTHNLGGYLFHNLRKNNSLPKARLVHRLVMLAFVGECPPNQEVNHINGIRNDNRLCNLEYLTRQRNVQVGRAAKLTIEYILEIKKRIAAGEKHKDIAADYGVNTSVISQINTGVRWSNIVSPESAS